MPPRAPNIRVVVSQLRRRLDPDHARQPDHRHRGGRRLPLRAPRRLTCAPPPGGADGNKRNRSPFPLHSPGAAFRPPRSRLSMTPSAAAHPARPTLTLSVLSLAALAYILLQSLVVPALPTIGEELHTTQSTVTWVLTAYLLSASVATPILGRFGDMFGKKRDPRPGARVARGRLGRGRHHRVDRGDDPGARHPGRRRRDLPARVQHHPRRAAARAHRRRHRPDLGHHRHRRRLRDRAGGPDRRQPLVPLAVLDPGRAWPRSRWSRRCS